MNHPGGGRGGSDRRKVSDKKRLLLIFWQRPATGTKATFLVDSSFCAVGHTNTLVSYLKFNYVKNVWRDKPLAGRHQRQTLALPPPVKASVFTVMGISTSEPLSGLICRL